jgi:hypothetical protein
MLILTVTHLIGFVSQNESSKFMFSAAHCFRQFHEAILHNAVQAVG